VVLATGSEPRSLPGLAIDGQRSSPVTMRSGSTGYRVGGDPGRRGHRGGVRQRLAVIRCRGDHRRDAPPPAAPGGRVQLEAAGACLPPARDRLPAGGHVRRGEGGTGRADHHPGRREDTQRRADARRRRPRPGVGRARVRGGRGDDGPRLRDRGRVLPHQRPDHLSDR
jgi:hypothetical protein